MPWLLRENELIEHERVHTRAIEHADGVARTADDWLVKTVEGRVDEAGNAGRGSERLDQAAEPRWSLTVDALHAEGAGRAWQDVAESTRVPRTEIALHVRRIHRVIEELAYRRRGSAHGVSPPWLAPLQEAVQVLEHIW